MRSIRLQIAELIQLATDLWRSQEAAAGIPHNAFNVNESEELFACVPRVHSLANIRFPDGLAACPSGSNASTERFFRDVFGSFTALLLKQRKLDSPATRSMLPATFIQQYRLRSTVRRKSTRRQWLWVLRSPNRTSSVRIWTRPSTVGLYDLPNCLAHAASSRPPKSS